MKKALILAYFYPPIGGGGVQRTVKFVKYLPEFGYEPVVITGTGTESEFPEDTELEKEVSGVCRYDIQFSKSEKLLGSYLRGSIGRWTNTSMLCWLKAAGRTLEVVIEKEKPDILFVTTSPFPAAKVIGEVSRRFGIPYVLDMRDPWALDPITRYPTKMHYYLNLMDMRRACRRASAVIMNTPGALNAAVNAFRDIEQDKMFCITNGWDYRDFQTPRQNSNNSNKVLTIVHTGLFRTKIAKKYQQDRNPLRFLRYSVSQIDLLSRTPHYLFEAHRMLVRKNLINPKDIKCIFAGDVTEEDRELVLKHQVGDIVEFTGYLNHKQSIDLLNAADVLFLPLHELGDGKAPLIVPGKTYEYLASRKPILACVPKGDARDFVRKSGLGFACEPSDVNQIAEMILKLLEQHKSPEGIKLQPNDDFINQFERRRLTQKLADVFDYVL